ncbi:MAG: tRNA pseudouridine(38-40) synthase TruA [Promethearchaeota archaeon]|nr:MAG: tRNA pseudouridine(38-40) synthase TruA [Candidatus Lokiarchaeota archaeon]
MESRRYLLKFYYIGRKKFHGSQRQKNLLTIEECLINALNEKKYIKDVKTSGFEVASRTDRFVSARAAAFSFITTKKPILMEINSELPKEIGIWACSKVKIDFLSRFNAIYRHYKYIIPEPLDNIQKNSKVFDLNLIRKACKQLEGKHDFINFSKPGKEEEKTVRDMDSVKVSINNDFLVFDFKSRAFLRQQIRRMVKKILELGKGEIEYDDFLKLFDVSKQFLYQPADPSGLILWDIKFDDNIKFEVDIKSKKRMETYFLNQELKFGLKKQLFRILQGDDFS